MTGSTERTDDSSRPVSSLPATAAVIALLAVPMAVVPSGTGDLTLVSLWGFVNTGAVDPNASYHLYPVWSYFLDRTRSFETLPTSIRVWPVAIGFHLLASASAVGGAALGREDRRVTGGLLVLAALATLWVSIGVAGRFGVGRTASLLTVIPTGTVATLAVALVVYGRDLRRPFRR